MAGSGLVKVELRGAVRLVWLQSAPGNLFGPALCAALLSALRDAMADTHTQAVVLISALRGAAQGFSGGIDLADFGRPWPVAAPTPGDVARAVLEARCPVIAALHGPVLGAGAEIALAAQGRVASVDLRFGLRDVLVGRLPMAGATQTLPRLIGAPEALRLIGKGITTSAAEALAMGIVDRVTEGDLLAAALEMAASPPVPGRMPGLRDGRSYQAAVTQARGSVGADAAMAALVNCIEAAQLLPLRQGLDFEAEAAAVIAARPEAAALQHLIQAEMRMVVDLTGGKPAARIGLWGAACWPLIWPALRAGIEVVLADDDRTALLQAVERLALAQEEQVLAGHLTESERDLEWARLRPSLAVTDLEGLALVIAAKPGVSGQVLHLGPGHDAGPTAAHLHLIAPGFAELQVPPAQQHFGQIAAATLRQMRLRLAVTQGLGFTGCATAIVMAGHLACRVLVAQGVARNAIDAALSGVMRLHVPAADLAGEPMLDGQTAMPAEAIRNRVLGAIAAEGARLLMRGAVRRAAILDTLAVIALGMPRHLGGPLFAADQRGLLVVRRDLAQWQREHAVWAAPSLLDWLVSRGTRLSEMDGEQIDRSATEGHTRA